jgi:hypothetical protein
MVELEDQEHWRVLPTHIFAEIGRMARGDFFSFMTEQFGRSVFNITDSELTIELMDMKMEDY